MTEVEGVLLSVVLTLTGHTLAPQCALCACYSDAVVGTAESKAFGDLHGSQCHSRYDIPDKIQFQSQHVFMKIYLILFKLEILSRSPVTFKPCQQMLKMVKDN